MNFSTRDLLLCSMVLALNLSILNGQVRFQDKSLPCIDKNFNIQIVMSVDSTHRQPLLPFETVQEIIEDVNYYFEPICLSLSSCDYKVIEQDYSYSKIRSDFRLLEARIVHSLPRRINIFFSKEIVGDQCGHSAFYGFFDDKLANIFVELDCQDGPAEQIAHHLGHLLGLSPTNFTELPELVDGSNCHEVADSICDTPADPYHMLKQPNGEWVHYAKVEKDSIPVYNKGCEFVWEGVDDNGEVFTPHTSNMMSRYHCKCEFTREQYLKMVENYYKSTIKQY